jgi:phage terminase small subunit
MTNILNHRQGVFVQEYLKSGNATEAATKAGYSKKTAYSQGQRLLKKAEVQKTIKAHNHATEEETGVTVQGTVRRIHSIATATKRDGDKLKALDMLMRHLGGYVTISDLLDKMTEEQIDQLAQRVHSSIKLNLTDEAA